MTALLLALIPELFSIGSAVAKAIAAHPKDERTELMAGEVGDGLRNIRALADDMLQGKEIDLSSYDIPESWFTKLKASGHADVIEAVRKRRAEMDAVSDV